MKFSVLTLTFVLSTAAMFAAGCSSRVVYDSAPQYTVPENSININTASADDLEKLPHIGRKTAEAVVAFREENGPFRRPEHLLLIRGVSEKRFAEIGPLRTE